MTDKEVLEQGLQALELSLDEHQLQQLLQLQQSLLKWNRTFNLTAIRSEKEVLSYHLLDSLSIEPFIRGKRVIDVGSGGGFPGLPLAICLPACRFTLLDSNVKKTRFLQQMVIELGLNNCEVAHQRVEDHGNQYDQVTCRAFASLADIVDKTAHLLSHQGEILAMKGRLGEEAKALLPLGAFIHHVESMSVPGVEGERHLVVIRFPKESRDPHSDST